MLKHRVRCLRSSVFDAGMLNRLVIASALNLDSEMGKKMTAELHVKKYCKGVTAGDSIAWGAHCKDILQAGCLVLEHFLSIDTIGFRKRLQ